ncbi:hypothetical protein TNCV_2930531 [Trichonephila clavipes]|nr:hypothetical protein TNCV_2930531 [Trichonephila clavipes]
MRQANQQFSSILKKIGNGERLDEIEIFLIESRFYSVEEAATMCHQVLSETWLNNESEINITNFKCIAKFKRPNTRAGGVGIYHNSNDVINIATSSIDFSVFSPDFHGSLASAVGDLCMAQCQMELKF